MAQEDESIRSSAVKRWVELKTSVGILAQMIQKETSTLQRNQDFS